MRFRRLTTEELTHLESDFVQFLASNQITAKDWIALKETDMNRVDELIDLFSDIVLEKVLGKIEYLQHRTKDTLRLFYCQEDKITMTALQITDPNKDLTNPADLATLAQPQNTQHPVKLFQLEKNYTENRADTVFEMIYRDGCQTASKEMYEALLMINS